MSIVFPSADPQATQLIELRQAQGLDGHDEIWDGDYIVTPYADGRHSRVQHLLGRILGPLVEARGFVMTNEFNLGRPSSPGTHDGDYRVPDLGVHAGSPTELYFSTAVAVGEVISPDDKTWQKFGFYHDHRVAEIFVADPVLRSVQFFSWTPDGYVQSLMLACAEITVQELQTQIAWP